MKRAVLHLLQAITAGAWGFGFRLIQLGQNRRRESRSHGRVTALDPRPTCQRQEALRVLAIAPHPDDEMAGCGGALLLHRRRGHAATIVLITDGRRSGAFGLDPDTMARRRRLEAEAAARHLGAKRCVYLGLPEGAWSSKDAVPQLVALLERTRPHLIYAPSRVDFHSDHVTAAGALAGALEAARFEGWTRCFQLQVPLTSILVNCVLDIGEVGDSLHRGLRLYRTQYGSLERCLRMRRYAGRRRARRLCEEYWQLSTEAYVHLHRGRPDDQERTAYRALRYLAISDPFAYLKGRGQRRRVAALASSSPPNEASVESAPPGAAGP